MTTETVTVTDRDQLRELRAKATPGPYRAHDHNDMARLGEDPVKWLGYAWVGRITKQSEPDGRFDAGWLDRDSRGDACKEYRERASADAHYVAAAMNAMPLLLDYIDALEARLASEARSSSSGEVAYLVWSNEHAAWWGPDRCGYTRHIDRAGRYARDEALRIAGTRDGGWRLNKGNPDEIAIPELDAVEQYAEITAALEGKDHSNAG